MHRRARSGPWAAALLAGLAVIPVLLLIGVAVGVIGIVGLWIVISPFVGMAVYSRRKEALVARAEARRQASIERVEHEYNLEVAPLRQAISEVAAIATRCPTYEWLPRRHPRLA